MPQSSDGRKLNAGSGRNLTEALREGRGIRGDPDEQGPAQRNFLRDWVVHRSSLRQGLRLFGVVALDSKIQYMWRNPVIPVMQGAWYLMTVKGESSERVVLR